jgi:phenylacetate-coenzyme A ligase PaaK-like adenylate-forming protein
MPEFKDIERQIFEVNSPGLFNELALKIFHLQYKKTTVYRRFVDYLNVDITRVNHFSEIPFMPIEFFKQHQVLTDGLRAEEVFKSSGTTGRQSSRHYVAKTDVYIDSFTKGFKKFFGQPDDYIILALLPSYLEQGGSSLVYMAQRLIELSGQKESGFYLDNYQKLAEVLTKLCETKKKVILLGVTYALLDLAERFPLQFSELILVETGGMKGRRQEIIREELHETLKQAFGIKQVCSEYGMTELLSQAWSKGEGIFETPPWMKVIIRDVNDPLSLLPEGKSGGINLIDLANLYSCSFIASGDLGKILPGGDGRFSVLGRFDNSDVRGCNLLVG